MPLAHSFVDTPLTGAVATAPMIPRGRILFEKPCRRRPNVHDLLLVFFFGLLSSSSPVTSKSFLYSLLCMIEHSIPSPCRTLVHEAFWCIILSSMYFYNILTTISSVSSIVLRSSSVLVAAYEGIQPGISPASVFPTSRTETHQTYYSLSRLSRLSHLSHLSLSSTSSFFSFYSVYSIHIFCTTPDD